MLHHNQSKSLKTYFLLTGSKKALIQKRSTKTDAAKRGREGEKSRCQASFDRSLNFHLGDALYLAWLLHNAPLNWAVVYASAHKP
jgi:hypothetical protein